MQDSPNHNGQPLAGILVLDFSRAVAGPMCSMLLADLGARVIKIEEPAGDESRRWGPPFVGADSTYFRSYNRNKESAALDLKNPADVALVRSMAARADVVIENFRPGVMARLGLDAAALRAERPSLIYASVSGFGQTGPDRDRPGYDLILQAVSGLMYTSGPGDGTPGKTSFPIADILAALFLHQAVLAALYRRQVSGEGAVVDVTLLDSLLAGMGPLTSAYLMAGVDPKPAGMAHANIAPYQVFACAGGQVAVGVANERLWQRFCVALGREEWLADARFASNVLRNANRAALLALVEPVLMTRTAREWEAALRAAEVPCGAVQTVGQALEMPCVRSVVTLADGLRVLGNPAVISGHEAPTAEVPTCGADTERLRAEFGGAG